MTSAWLGLQPDGEDRWRLPVTPGVISGASALFGGCATASACVAARAVTEHPVVFAASHFGALAKVGTEATIATRVIAAGRTLTHLEVEGTVDGTQSWLTRVSAGSRPAREKEGEWVAAPSVPPPDGCDPFPHPVHEGTWADRFEFRLAGTGQETRPYAAWWVRPKEEIEPIVAAAILVDYVTYGVGRALGVPMGGLSIDNVLRMHRPMGAEWYLLQVLPDAIDTGLGFGTAHLFADGALVATGTQSIVVNSWDWRLPEERNA